MIPIMALGLDIRSEVMTNNMDNYWIDEIESYKRQLHTCPDDKHNLWKWREVLKIRRIMNAETKCKARINGGTDNARL